MRVLAWNILAGDRARGDRIVDAIRAHAPDAIVLCEYKKNGSAKIIESLSASGWSHVEVTSQKPRQGGIAVLSLSPLVARERQPCFEELERHYLAMCVPEYGLELRAIYGPLHRDTHVRYWTELLSSLRLEAGGDVLVVGDFNSGSPSRDAPIPNVFSGR